MAVARVAWRWCALALGVSSLAACERATIASFVPVLELRVVAQRAGFTGTTLDYARGDERWDAAIVANLRFRPSFAAAAVPERIELNPAHWLAPCDLDDAICIEETQAAERELAGMLGELQ